MSADIRVIYESNFRDPVATLRRLASDIETGVYGDVSQVAVVVLGDKCDVFGAGAESEPCVTAVLLQAGAQNIIESVARAGRD